MRATARLMRVSPVKVLKLIRDAGNAAADFHHLRRYTRRTNAHSKRWELHIASLAFWFAYYNWVRPHETLRGRSPAQTAGLATRRYTMTELVRYCLKL